MANPWLCNQPTPNQTPCGHLLMWGCDEISMYCTVVLPVSSIKEEQMLMSVVWECLEAWNSSFWHVSATPGHTVNHIVFPLDETRRNDKSEKREWLSINTIPILDRYYSNHQLHFWHCCSTQTTLLHAFVWLGLIDRNNGPGVVAPGGLVQLNNGDRHRAIKKYSTLNCSYEEYITEHSLWLKKWNRNDQRVLKLF